METLEKSRMCRLCGKQSGIAIDIFDKNESHVRKINAILPILVHEMDLLPKQMCHRCSYKLEEFYNFYVDCAKTDTELKNQLSWMRKENLEEKIVTPMVKMIPFKIKAEPPDTLNSDNVFNHVNDNSLLFPESVLQNSFNSNMGPILSCSRCQCLCNTTVKINKTSPKSRKIDTEHQARSSKASNDSFVDSELSISKDDSNYFKNDFIEDGNFKETQMKKKLIMKLDNIDFSKSDTDPTNSNDSTQFKNRALRPRRGSIDYIGHKKKGVASNLKDKFNSKLDMLNPALINPVEIKVSQGNSTHSSPIIKLEKVDDTIKSLRVHKNLKEFNRIIKAFKCKRIKHKSENLRMQVLHKVKPFSPKEDVNRKSLQKKENEKVSVQTQEIFTLRRKSSHAEDRQCKKSLWSEEDGIKTTEQTDDNSISKCLKVENDQTRKNFLKVNVNKSHSQEKEESERTESNLNNFENNDNNENFRLNISDVVIKQEVINKTLKNNETLSDEVKVIETGSCKDKHCSKSIDRLPLCAVVKLEKDYTCNVDYPRIKIKRHLAVANSSKSEDSVLETLPKQTCPGEKTARNKSLIKKDLINKKKLKNKKKKIKNSKNGVKHFSVVKNKLTGSDKTQADLKCYCEECDVCFRTRELYKLHPCYHK